MSKELLTLEEKFRKYQDVEFCVRLHKDNSNCKIKFTVVGYTKGSDNYLIGKLVENQGVSNHFFKAHSFDYIEDKENNGRYIYVNLRSIEKYPQVKRTVRRKTVEELNHINIDELKF